MGQELHKPEEIVAKGRDRSCHTGMLVPQVASTRRSLLGK
jgi:hypothetical protein